MRRQEEHNQSPFWFGAVMRGSKLTTDLSTFCSGSTVRCG